MGKSVVKKFKCTCFSLRRVYKTFFLNNEFQSIKRGFSANRNFSVRLKNYLFAQNSITNKRNLVCCKYTVQLPQISFLIFYFHCSPIQKMKNTSNAIFEVFIVPCTHIHRLCGCFFLRWAIIIKKDPYCKKEVCCCIQVAQK